MVQVSWGLGLVPRLWRNAKQIEKMKILTSRMRLLIAMLAIILLAVLFWFAKGEELFDAQMKPWATFRIPANATRLEAQITVVNQNVTLCNRSQARWDNILVQLNGWFLVKVESLTPGACREFNVRNFASPTWKRLPPASNAIPHTIGVLASTTQTGYSRTVF